MKDKPPIKKEFTTTGDQRHKHHTENLKTEDENLKIIKSHDDNSRAEELEKLLNTRESEIKTLQERLNNDKEILYDVISEKKLLNKKIQDLELKEIDAKLNDFQKLQQKHHKTKHRLQVTKNLLDEANKKIDESHHKIDELNIIIEDLKNMGIINHVIGRFPESYKEYEKNK